jgi:hypothetical protein
VRIYTAQGIRTTTNLHPHEFPSYVQMLEFLDQKFPGETKDTQTYVVLCDLKDGKREQAAALDYVGLMVDYDGEERKANPEYAEWAALGRADRLSRPKPKTSVAVQLPYDQTPTPLMAHEHLVRMGISHLIYPSFSHIPGIKNKFRIVIPFASPLPASNLQQAVKHVMAACAIPSEWIRGMDMKAMSARSQGFYLYSGIGPAGELPRHIFLQGRPISLPAQWPAVEMGPPVADFDRSILAKIAGEGINPCVIDPAKARRGLEILGLKVGPLQPQRGGGFRVRCSCPDAEAHGSGRDKDVADTECFLRAGEIPRLYCHHTGCYPSFSRMIEEADESLVRALRAEGCFAAYKPDISAIGERPEADVMKAVMTLSRGLAPLDRTVFLDELKRVTRYSNAVIKAFDADSEDESLDRKAKAKLLEMLSANQGRFRTVAGNSPNPVAQVFNGRFWQYLPLNILEQMAQEVLTGLAPGRTIKDIVAHRTALVSFILRDVVAAPPEVEAIAGEDAECVIIARNCELILSPANGGKPVCRDFSPETNATSGIDVDFIPGATCPRFLRVVEESFPDPDIRLIVQQVFGAAVAGYRPAGLRGCAIVGGSMAGFDGKNSLFGGVLVKLLGPGTVHSNPDLHGLMHDDRRAYALVGKQMLLIDDRERREPMYMSDIKNIGETKSRATRRLYADTVDNLISVMPISLSNDWPTILGVDRAGVSRILAIPMDKSYAGKDVPNPYPEIERYELPGVLNWAIEGLQSLVANGRFNTRSAAHREALERMLRRASGEYNFCKTQCLIGPEHRVYLRDFVSALSGFFKSTRIGREDRIMAVDVIGALSLLDDVVYDDERHVIRGLCPKSVIESNTELPS